MAEAPFDVNALGNDLVLRSALDAAHRENKPRRRAVPLAVANSSDLHLKLYTMYTVSAAESKKEATAVYDTLSNGKAATTAVAAAPAEPPLPQSQAAGLERRGALTNVANLTQQVTVLQARLRKAADDGQTQATSHRHEVSQLSARLQAVEDMNEELLAAIGELEAKLALATKAHEADAAAKKTAAQASTVVEQQTPAPMSLASVSSNAHRGAYSGGGGGSDDDAGENGQTDSNAAEQAAFNRNLRAQPRGAGAARRPNSLPAPGAESRIDADKQAKLESRRIGVLQSLRGLSGENARRALQRVARPGITEETLIEAEGVVAKAREAAAARASTSNAPGAVAPTFPDTMTDSIRAATLDWHYAGNEDHTANGTEAVREAVGKAEAAEAGVVDESASAEGLGNPAQHRADANYAGYKNYDSSRFGTETSIDVSRATTADLRYIAERLFSLEPPNTAALAVELLTKRSGATEAETHQFSVYHHRHAGVLRSIQADFVEGAAGKTRRHLRITVGGVVASRKFFSAYSTLKEPGTTNPPHEFLTYRRGGPGQGRALLLGWTPTGTADTVDYDIVLYPAWPSDDPAPPPKLAYVRPYPDLVRDAKSWFVPAERRAARARLVHPLLNPALAQKSPTMSLRFPELSADAVTPPVRAGVPRLIMAGSWASFVDLDSEGVAPKSLDIYRTKKSSGTQYRIMSLRTLYVYRNNAHAPGTVVSFVPGWLGAFGLKYTRVARRSITGNIANSAIQFTGDLQFLVAEVVVWQANGAGALALSHNLRASMLSDLIDDNMRANEQQLRAGRLDFSRQTDGAGADDGTDDRLQTAVAKILADVGGGEGAPPSAVFYVRTALEDDARARGHMYEVYTKNSRAPTSLAYILDDKQNRVYVDQFEEVQKAVTAEGNDQNKLPSNIEGVAPGTPASARDRAAKEFYANDASTSTLRDATIAAPYAAAPKK